MDHISKQQELYNLCKQFIQKHYIYCAETIYQSDRIIENATEFIEQICNVVGYEPLEDDDGRTN